MTEQTAKYLAIQEIASLLRETTEKIMITTHKNSDGTECTPEDIIENMFSGKQVFTHTEFVSKNSVFTNEEHETVKRTFLRLCEEL